MIKVNGSCVTEHHEEHYLYQIDTVSEMEIEDNR